MDCRSLEKVRSALALKEQLAGGVLYTQAGKVERLSCDGRQRGG